MSSVVHETIATTAAVILAGGASTRMGGVDKTRLPVAGVSSLERVLRSAPAATRIVVGPAGADRADLAARHGAHFVLEDPPGSGPLAALACGVGALQGLHGAPLATVVVLGGDMPLLRQETLEALAAQSVREQRVVALVDAEGQTQFLCAAWPAPRLRAALAAIERPGGGWAELSLRSLYAQLGPDEIETRAMNGREGADIDTPQALQEARRAAGPRIALAQITVHEDIAQNVETVRRYTAEAAAAGAQLVLFPEATLTPFGTPLRAAAQQHHSAFVGLLEELATTHDITIAAGSFSPADGDRVYNTMIIRGPRTTDPLRTEYRKIHLFDAYGARESETVAPGDRLVTFDLDGVRLGIVTCYDVRFPEQFVELARRGAQAILVPLAWAEGPGKREQLRILLQARALDSTTVVLAADQAPPPGYSGRGPRGIGRSAVIGPLGQIRQELGTDEGLLVTDLDLEEIRAARWALPVIEHGMLS